MNNATADKLSSIGAGSPNKLLYSLAGAPNPDAAPVAAYTFNCSGLTCTFDGSGSTDNAGISAYAWNFGDRGTGSGATASHTFGSAGTFTVVLTVTDTAGQTDTETKSVSVSNGNTTDPCTNCTRYAGNLGGAGGSQYQPNGTYYLAQQAGTHRGWLRGAANTDFDLYLWRWNGSQ